MPGARGGRVRRRRGRAACGGPVYSYRYRLTVEVDTPGGPKSGSSVIETTGAGGRQQGLVGTDRRPPRTQQKQRRSRFRRPWPGSRTWLLSWGGRNGGSGRSHSPEPRADAPWDPRSGRTADRPGAERTVRCSVPPAADVRYLFRPKRTEVGPKSYGRMNSKRCSARVCASGALGCEITSNSVTRQIQKQLPEVFRAYFSEKMIKSCKSKRLGDPFCVNSGHLSQGFSKWPFPTIFSSQSFRWMPTMGIRCRPGQRPPWSWRCRVQYWQCDSNHSITIKSK